jgi:hypothetical protein
VLINSIKSGRRRTKSLRQINQTFLPPFFLLQTKPYRGLGGGGGRVKGNGMRKRKERNGEEEETDE